VKRQVVKENEVMNEINITPLLDLAWVLLVVFVISITAAVQGIKVALPKASSAASPVKPTTKAITVDEAGQIYLDAFPVTIQELEANLRSLKAIDPNFPVVIRGDEGTYYKNVIAVLDLLSKLDITQIGLATQKLVK
jgi:biopolymer transport protein ExbD